LYDRKFGNRYINDIESPVNHVFTFVLGVGVLRVIDVATVSRVIA